MNKVLVFIILFLLPLNAQAAGLFGKKDKGPQPQDTLVAPFADSQRTEVPAGQVNELYSLKDTAYHSGLQGDLSKAHKPDRDVAAWLERAVTETLTFKAEDYARYLEFIATGMDEYGIADYQKFIGDKNIIDTLRRGGLRLQSYVEKPVLIKKGALEGRFRWLYEIPLTMSYVPADAVEYIGVVPDNHYYMLQVQVGRVVPKADGAPDILIESWNAEDR